MHWGILQPSVKLLGGQSAIITSNSEAMVLDRKKVVCGSVESLWPRVKSSSISGSCLRVRENWSVRSIGGLVVQCLQCS